MLIGCLYIEYFLLLFTVLLSKLQYELLVGSNDTSVGCLLYSNCICLLRGVVHQCPKQSLGTKNTKNCFALSNF